ncbi:MAG TPA: N-acetylmuramoyl-L-alanine amidase [Pseudonocardia sp.]|nr:N-acetylmuramoyl-L-alanine amidase [Pseudonocardia sp.]
MGGAGLSRRAVLIGGMTGLLTVTGWTLEADRALATAPPFVDCAGWGARPPSAPSRIWNRRPVRILVHHTATPNVRDLSRAAAVALARGIQNFHMDRRGWTDSGQHLTISRGGVVLEGRHRSLEMLAGGTRAVQGAHCTGQNVVAVGIESQGTYLDVDPPPELWNGLRETCAHICRRYRIAPGEIFGHRDFKNTACPGDRLYGMLPLLRSEVAGLLGRRVESAPDGGVGDPAVARATWPLLRPGDSGTDVLAAQLLLRAVGVAGVAPTGRFDASTDEAVRAFQQWHRAEEVNGLLGAESWPVLAAEAGHRPGDGDVHRAVRVLAGLRRTEAARAGVTGSRVPDLPQWQRLLGTGGVPIDPLCDPPLPPG